MEDINFKELDRKSILSYLGARKGIEVEVAKIIAESGANKLRVYTILIELSLEGVIRVTLETDLGTPEKVMMSA